MNADVAPNTYQLVDSEGTPLISRLPNGQAMATMLEDMITADAQAALFRASIMGMINGNKPFSDKKLKNDGQSYRSNWNDRQSESILDTRVGADFNMLFDTSRTIEVSFLPGFFPNPLDAQRYGDAIAQAFTYIFTQEPQIIESALRAIRDKNELGVGFLIYPDKFDWRPKAIRRGRCFFNETASANCEDIGVFYALDTMTVTEAWGHIEKAEASEKAGWYIDKLKRALVDVFYPEAQRKKFQDSYVLMFEDLEARVRTNDPVFYSRQYDVFPIVHGFIEERSGKVSQYLQPYRTNSPDWIFASHEAMDGMEDFVIPLPYDYGDGTLASVKGLGHRIFALCTELNRSLMHTLDAGKLATSFILKNASSGDNLAFSMLRAGPVTMIDKQLEPIQTSFSPKMEPSIAIQNLLQGKLNTNTNTFRTPAAQSPTNSKAVPTAEQIRAEAGQEVKTENDRKFLMYLRWDALVKQTFKRLVSPNSRHPASPVKAKKSAELFWTMCEALGVPRVLLEDHADKIIVRATRAIGAGSPYAKQQNLVALKNLTYNSMSEQGKREADRELASVLVGSDNVGKFIPRDSNQIPSDAHSHARLELNDAYEGQQTLVGADQLHTAHIAVPMAAMLQEAQAFQQNPTGVDIEKLAKMFQTSIPHVQRHIEYLATDPLREKEVEGYMQQLQQIMQVAQVLFREYEKIMKAKQAEEEARMQELMQLRQSQDKVYLEDQRERLKIQLAHQREMENTQNLNANRDVKTEVANQIKIEREGLDAAIKQQRLRMEEMERMMKMRLDEMEALAKTQGAGSNE